MILHFHASWDLRFWAVWPGSAGARTPLPVEQDFSLSWGLEGRWAGEIQAPANRESHPLMFPSCSIPGKRSFPTPALRDSWFCAIWDASASPCGVHVAGLWHWRTTVCLSCLHVSSSSISSVWVKDTVCSAASAAAFRQHQLLASDS